MGFVFAFVLPTTRCEVRCDFCFYETGHSPRVEEVNYLAPLGRALDALETDGLQQVILSGGEPALSRHFESLLELLSRRLLHVLLLTHGDVLNEQLLQLLERQGVDDLSISVHDASDHTRRIVDRVLFHSRYIPNLLSCISRANVDQVAPMLELSGRRGLPHLFTPVFVPAGAACHERHSLHHLEPERWQELLARLEPWAESTRSEFYLAMIRDHFRGMPVHPGFCPMGTEGLVIDADANVYPCFHRHDLCAGNLLRHPWPEIQQRLEQMGQPLISAPCFGEHCLSMFAGIQE